MRLCDTQGVAGPGGAGDDAARSSFQGDQGNAALTITAAT